MALNQTKQKNTLIKPFQSPKKALDMLQYKILHDVVYTKSILFKTKLAQSKFCYLCQETKQDLIRMLVSRPRNSGKSFSSGMRLTPLTSCEILYTAISIYVVWSKLQAYTTRPNGGLDIHWNLHIGEDQNYKFKFLRVEPAWA